MLITFEGIDGSGKSTQARRLVERLEREGYPTVFVREPGGTPLAERIRDLLLDPDLDPEPFAELLLFSAARAQLVARRIRPALETGRIVVCDRFFDSTIAYQGGGRGVADPAWLQDFQRQVTGGLVPDRTYLIDLPVEEAQARRNARATGAVDRMEAGDRAFHNRVAAAYAVLADAEPNRIVRLDSRAPIEAVHARIWDDVQPRLPQPSGTAHRSDG